ncbi:MAG: hypothetical protein GY869_06330 [Planctomycetes bacterium]|nr:hypothetical protein [Planctomycetota bacterium]
MKYELINKFHNTSANVLIDGERDLTASQMKRASRKLCGMSDCGCGGINNKTVVMVDGEDSRLTVVECHDGTGMLLKL